MDIIYRTGKFYFEKIGNDERFRSKIAALRLMAGDFGPGDFISRTPETEREIQQMAQERYILIHCQGIYKKALIRLNQSGAIPSANEPDDSGSTQEIHLSGNQAKKGSKTEILRRIKHDCFPLEGIHYKIYDTLKEIEQERIASNEEVYDVIIETHQKGSTSSIIHKAVKAETFAAKLKLNL